MDQRYPWVIGKHTLTWSYANTKIYTGCGDKLSQCTELFGTCTVLSTIFKVQKSAGHDAAIDCFLLSVSHPLSALSENTTHQHLQCPWDAELSFSFFWLLKMEIHISTCILDDLHHIRWPPLQNHPSQASDKYVLSISPLLGRKNWHTTLSNQAGLCLLAPSADHQPCWSLMCFKPSPCSTNHETSLLWEYYPTHYKTVSNYLK